MAIRPWNCLRIASCSVNRVFPIPFGLNADHTIASQFYPSAKFGNFSQERELLWATTHADHELHNQITSHRNCYHVENTFTPSF